MNIRLATVGDAPEMLALHRDILQKPYYFVTRLNEFDRTLEEQIAWIEEKQTNEREVVFVAEEDDKVVGWLYFQSSQRVLLQHVGTIGMMVDEKYRHQGIGIALLKYLLKWARKNPLIEKVSLSVFSINEPAIALYKKAGFLEEGRKVKEFKIDDDQYIDDILMYKFV
ncbi:GNAT family N-acetyltransferase [Kurthia massiliensis]|uniref:GNAT family N-acetyltransferase n=1 Tax=Kurthia massiliensis TaxID=1033739 RepID=UPI0002882118|nr:GNAT family N-acetyltransferase [Kurthia massiliensis]